MYYLKSALHLPVTPASGDTRASTQNADGISPYFQRMSSLTYIAIAI